MESRTRLRFWNGNTVKGSLRNDDMKTENGNMKVYCTYCSVKVSVSVTVIFMSFYEELDI
jgi:hypothetical protein